MSGIVLHHFDISPFAEKIRLVLGLKQLSWHSVEIPLIMPKPDLTLLTGGYRKTPVLQIGADIFCDTRCIALELEKRFPTPSLFPDASRELALMLGSWADQDFFRVGAALSMGTNEELPDDLLQDRKAFFSFMDFAELPKRVPSLLRELAVHFHALNARLNEGHPYLLGDTVSWADILCYFPVWMSRGNIAAAEEILKPLAALAHWERRVAALGHGKREEMTAERSILLARESQPDYNYTHTPSLAAPLQTGQRVSVAASDYGKDPVSGELLAVNSDTMVILRREEQIGEVAVHFPCTGYTLEALN